jgi:hypothetical protein
MGTRNIFLTSGNSVFAVRLNSLKETFSPGSGMGGLSITRREEREYPHERMFHGERFSL